MPMWLKVVGGIFLGLGFFALVIFSWVSGTYNGLVRSSNAVDAQWAQVEASYQRRMDLIPNVVAAVQGAMAQEKDIFTRIADSRRAYQNAISPEDKLAAGDSLGAAIGRLLVVYEAQYPNLKSIDSINGLVAELAGTENRINVERRRFNEHVQAYNTQVQTFPSNVLAGMFGFSKKAYFEADKDAGRAPKVDLTKP